MGIAEIIALAPSVIKLGSSAYEWISNIRKAAKQRDEWTPELEAAFQAKLDAAGKQAHWQTDKGLADRE
jgi:hypothetical protein